MVCIVKHKHLLGLSADKGVLLVRSREPADVHHALRADALELVWCAHVYLKIYLYYKWKCN